MKTTLAHACVALSLASLSGFVTIAQADLPSGVPNTMPGLPPAPDNHESTPGSLEVADIAVQAPNGHFSQREPWPGPQLLFQASLAAASGYASWGVLMEGVLFLYETTPEPAIEIEGNAQEFTRQGDGFHSPRILE